MILNTFVSKYSLLEIVYELISNNEIVCYLIGM